jgi:hypothetical protein
MSREYSAFNPLPPELKRTTMVAEMVGAATARTNIGLEVDTAPNNPE